MNFIVVTVRMNYLRVLNEAFDVAERISKHLQASGEAAQPLTRGAFGDLTYRIDKEVESAIIKVVKKHLPDSLIISEETGTIGDEDGSPLVLIDPVDGSTNAYQNIPLYSSAIAIINGHTFADVAAAGVADIVHGERIISEGRGEVTVNGHPAHPSPAKPLDQAYVNLNLKTRTTEKAEEWLVSLLRKIRYARFLGSAALETAYVAAGRSNAYIQLAPNLRTFDCIGALYLVKEAGGWIEFLNINIEKVDLRDRERFAYVAACDAVMGQLIMSTEPRES